MFLLIPWLLFLISLVHHTGAYCQNWGDWTKMEDMCAVLFYYDHCEGDYLILRKNTANNDLSSFKIGNSNDKRMYFNYGSSHNRRRKRANWEDNAISVIVKPGCKLDLFEDENFKGRELHLTDKTHNRFEYYNNWRNEASSYRCNCEAPAKVVGVCNKTYEGGWKDIMTCIGNTVEPFQCKATYTIGTMIGSRHLDSTHDRNVIQVGSEVNFLDIVKASFSYTKDWGVHVEHETSSHKMISETSEILVSVPINKTVTIKQAYGQCGNAQFRSNLIRPEYTDNKTKEDAENEASANNLVS